MTQITVANISVIPLEHNAMRVVTTKQLAEFYGCEDAVLRKNFSNNKDNFVEGKHYFKLTYSQAVDLFKQRTSFTVEPSPNGLTVWTERGAARHAKILTTEKSWDVFEVLEDSYFKVLKVELTPLQLGELFVATEKARLAAVEQLKASEEKLALAAPKVQAFDNITASTYENNLRDSAKLLGIKPGKMSFWLSSLKWITQGNGKHWFPYQKVIDRGLMVVRENEIEMEDGSTKIRPQAMITQNGITTLALMIVNGECPVVENAKAATNLL